MSKKSCEFYFVSEERIFSFAHSLIRLHLSTPSDDSLIGRIRKNDKTAFRALFDRYYKGLLGTAINLLKEEDTGKDVVQEVFFSIWKNREKLEITSSVPGYLKRAVINRSLNHIKARKPFVDTSHVAETSSQLTSALDHLALKELETALAAALETLPERCRLVFVMKRLEGLSQKEIAELLNISPKTVENQITKAVKVLKGALHLYRKKN